MKRIVWSLFLFGLLSGTYVFAGVTVKTIKGKVYEDAEVKTVGPDNVVLLYSGGVVRVPLTELSKETRQNLKLEPTLVLAKIDFEKQIEGLKKVLEEFNLTYEKYLTKLEKELIDKGELEQLLLVRKEKAEFRKGVQLSAIKFAKLQQLRTIYSKGREKRRDQIANDLKPDLNAYLRDLNEIRKVLTIKGKIDEALIVKKEETRINVLLGNVKAAVFTLGIFPDPFIAVIAKKSPIVSAPTEFKQVEVKVNALQNRRQPLKTRVRLKKGEKYRITPNPSDKWTGGGSKRGVWCDYQGYGQTSNWMRMYSRIGDADEGKEFPVDPKIERLADARGVLYLFVEDTGPEGNEGEIRVTIQTKSSKD